MCKNPNFFSKFFSEKKTTKFSECQNGRFGNLHGNYDGTINVTNNGHTCESWSNVISKFPFLEYYMGSNVNHNYCRDPDAIGQAYCYYKDTVF